MEYEEAMKLDEGKLQSVDAFIASFLLAFDNHNVGRPPIEVTGVIFVPESVLDTRSDN